MKVSVEHMRQAAEVVKDYMTSTNYHIAAFNRVMGYLEQLEKEDKMSEWVLILGLSSMNGFAPAIPVPPIIIPMETKEACLKAVSADFIRPMYAKLCVNTQTGEVLQK